MSKLIKAVFTGRFCKTQRVFQFDSDDKLQIVNMDLPANYTVDFSNSKTGDSVSVLATSDTVQIPPDLFVPGSEIYAWIWLSDSNGGHTRCEATIPIDPRARRTGTEPTPAQASAWDEAVDTLNETIEGIPAVVDAALTEAKESGEFDGADGADGNGVWYVDVQYTRTISAGVQAQLDHMVGRPGAIPAVGDLCVVSDGRFGAVTSITPRVAVVPVLGDLSGKSAYEIAVEHGYTGTEVEWLESLQGDDGFAPEVTIEQIDGGHRVTITSADYPEGQSFDVMNGQGGGITVDDEISTTSENPVQNKVVKAALDGKLGTSGAGSDVTVAFTAAAQRTAIGTGEKLSTLFGKILKWLSDLGTAAFKNATNSIAQGSTDLVESGAVHTELAKKYEKPQGGIPATDLAETYLTQHQDISGKLDKAQGVAHAGEFCVVGSDGNVTTMALSTWSAGSY